MKITKILSLVLGLCLFSQLSAHEYLTSSTHSDVYAKSNELRAKYGSARNVLVVFDIDNTLLKARQPLGSDQWFEWQAEAIKSQTNEAIFRTFDELLAAQADFFQLSTMNLTERNLPEMITSLKRFGHHVVLLTSRGPGLRNVTERELLKNGLWFADSSIMYGAPNDFMEPPFKLPVSFMNGIFMTSGHHKGEALDYLVKKSRKTFKAIIFADDHERHTKRVYETFSPNTNTEIVTFRYSKEDEAVANFKSGSKTHVNAQAIELIRTYRKIFQ